MSSSSLQDAAVRNAAFRWLETQVHVYGDVLPRAVLATGFEYQGQRVPLLGPKGIFKPALMDLPISITTIPNGPYDDGYLSESLIRYRYRGTDPQHPDNQGLRSMMKERIPLVYFYQVATGKYLAVWPVFIVGDSPNELNFSVQVDDPSMALYSLHTGDAANELADSPGDERRAYITATVRQRVHQRSFRERVLMAYREQCAMCRLKHVGLLDAAHIVPDNEPDGEPVVPNGLSLCKLHHAAFDQNFLGIRPDCVVEVRKDILDENDGPMLLHGLKAMHGQALHVPSKPSDRPAKVFLENRYERFLALT